MATGEDDAGGVRSIARALRVLEHLAAVEPVRVGEVAPAVGLSKSTAQRVLRTLEESGWIRPGPGMATWEIDPRIRLLLAPGRDDAELRRIALPVMRDLRDSTGETIHLTVPVGQNQVRIAERVDTGHELRSVVPVGTVFDADAVAAGLAIRAWRTDVPWIAHPAPTGHSVGIAAAVRDAHAVPVAALVVVVPTVRHRQADDARYGAAVAESAALLSRLLGGV